MSGHETTDPGTEWLKSIGIKVRGKVAVARLTGFPAEWQGMAVDWNDGIAALKQAMKSRQTEEEIEDLATSFAAIDAAATSVVGPLGDVSELIEDGVDKETIAEVLEALREAGAALSTDPVLRLLDDNGFVPLTLATATRSLITTWSRIAEQAAEE